MSLATTAIAVLSLVLSVVALQPTAKTVAVHAAAMLDVRQGRTIDDAIVVVSGDRILYAGAAAGAKVPADAQRIDLGQLTLLPGLIDAHVHLSLAGDPAANARATVEAGFTTVQDLGATDAQVLSLRDDIVAGRVVGPRVLAAGRWIGVRDGICNFGGIGVQGASAFRERVAEEVRRGADLIKVCVSGWLTDARRDPKRYEISDDELRAAIDEAHRLKRRVAVHAISAAGVEVAVRLGADLVVHAAFVDPKTVEAMHERRVYLLPTLFSFHQGQPPEDVAAVQSHVANAARSGLPVAFGTDAGVIPHGRNAREFQYLRDLGLSPLEVIRTATLHGAAAVGMADKVGVLQAGASADVIAVEGDPMRDLAALQQVRFVMSRGSIVKRP